MGYFQVRYDYRVVNYDCRGFIRLATGLIFRDIDCVRERWKCNGECEIMFVKERESYQKRKLELTSFYLSCSGASSVTFLLGVNRLKTKLPVKKTFLPLPSKCC